MQKVKFEAGEMIFAEGDPSDHCYKIVSGKVEIKLDVPGMMKRDRKETVATCGPGEVIGEMSVIERGARSASAVAVEPTVCNAYTAQEILHALESNPREAIAYIKTLIRRIRHTNRRVSWNASHRL